MAAVSDEATAAAIAKLEADGAAAATIGSFAGQMQRLAAGDLGMLPESELDPVTELPDAERLEVDGEAIAELLDQTVVIKLNGGLGTSMGLAGPKSLLEVKDGLSFLDITARQIKSLRAEHGGARLPLVLLDSFRTREPSLAALASYADLSAELEPDFLQGRVPKLIDDGGLAPATWPADPELEWSPQATAIFTPRWSDRGCSRQCWQPATATPSSPTPTTSAPCLTRQFFAGLQPSRRLF